MEKPAYEVPRTRMIAICFESILLNPSDQLPSSEEYEGGDY